MPLSTNQYGYIIDPLVPLTDDTGRTISNGYIRVFMAGTSTPVLTYKNFDGSTNEETVQLDNSGRTAYPVIGSKGSTYKVCVYDAEHSQETPIKTIDKVVPTGASVEATNFVTGLDSVTVQEENFLKATVTGTDVELALDPTEVTSEVSTISDAATAAPDYDVPLLDKTGTGDSKKISLANIFKFALDWISRLATTITSFASGDFFAVSNMTDGARKMSKDTLLQLTAQNALVGNIAQEFDPTRTSDNKYKAGESVLYNEVVKTFKVDHYGAWSDDDVYAEPADLANLAVLNLRKLDKVLTYQKPAGSSVNFNPFYTPTSYDSNTFRLEKVAYGSVTTYDIYANDSTSALSQTLLKSNVPFGDNVEIELPAGYDRILFYKGTNVTTGILVNIYNVNKNSLSYKVDNLDEKVTEFEGELVAKESAVHYTKAATAGQNLSFSYSPTAPGYFVLEKTAYGDVETYDIYKRDSSGVHSQSIYRSGVLFGEVIELALPEGYDNFLFYKGTTVSTGIDLTLYKANTDTLAWTVERLAGLDGEFVARTKERNLVKGAGTDDRLSFYWTPVESEEKVVVEKTDYAGVNTYDIYLSDSTNTNPLKVFRPNVRFGEIVPVKLSAGYDRFLFYKQKKTTNKIDVTLYRVLQKTLSGQVSLVGGDVDKLYPLKGRKLVCFGDSITQFSQDGWRYSDWFKDASKADVVNVGIGGTRYSLRTDVVETPTTSNQAWAAIDIYNLVHSWCENDFTAVDNAVQWLYDNESRDYGWIVNNLKNTPIASAEYVTLFAGTNDYGGGAELGAVNNGDEKTVLGALSSIVEELLTANPKLHIFIFSPIIRWFGSGRLPENFSDVYVRSSGSAITLKAFAEAICEAGKSLHIPTCDLYNSLGWTMWNYGEYFPVGDDTHPQYGFKNIGLRFNSFIVSQFSA